MRSMKRAIHLDFHTMPGIHDFNSEWDPQQFARQLKEANVDYINAFARCNIGFAYYPTRVGIPYPGMKGDMFGDLLQACHEVDIGVSAYINVGLDHEHASQHMDWLRLDKEGRVLRGDLTANFFRTLCYNNPDYRSYHRAMLEEVCAYDIDGLFLDCMVVEPCYCHHCLKKMKATGIDPYDRIANARFQEDTMVAFGEEVKEILGPGRYLWLNGLAYSLARHLDTHVEIECLPGRWGYDFFWPAVSYARKLHDHVVYMTGRFQMSWGDFGGLKTLASLEHDYYDALCAGAYVSIGDHMHPAKNLEPAVYKEVSRLNHWYARLQPHVDGTRYLADLALLIPSRLVRDPDNPGSGSLVNASLAGASRMLGELKQNYDVIDDTMDFTPYKLIILPDELIADEALAGKLSQYLARGGRVLATGKAGITTDGKGFALTGQDFAFAGLESDNVTFYRMEKIDDPMLPDMVHNTYGANGVRFEPAGKLIARSVKSYFNRHWDGFHAYYYTPPEKETGYAAAALSDDGSFGRIAFSIFKAYNETAAYPLKALLRQCLDQLLPDPLIKSEHIPSTARLTLTGCDDYALLHVKVTFPEVRGRMNIIEEHSTLPAGTVVKVRGSFKSAKLLPQNQAIDIAPEGGYVRLTLPAVTGYQMVRLER